MERDELPAGPRQWRFLGPERYVRPSARLALLNDVVAGCVGVDDGRPTFLDAPEPVTVERDPDTGTEPIRAGDRFAVRLGRLGFLTAAPAGPAGEPTVLVTGDPAPQWEVAGGSPGAAVSADRPTALFNLVQGDFLVAGRGADPADAMSWWATASGHLPAPGWARPPEGVPGDVELSGAAVPLVGVDPEAGTLLLLDRAESRALAEHLILRVPGIGAALAPDGALGAVACAVPRVGPASPGAGERAARQVVPCVAAGARLWVQGRFTAAPGAMIDPVRSVAWAVDVRGRDVEAAVGGVEWPALTVTWHLLLSPEPTEVPAQEGPDPGGSDLSSTVWLLALPGADGEPGTTTTFTVRRTAGADHRPTAGVPPCLVLDPRSGRRALRVALFHGGAAPVALTCVTRVHRRVPVAPAAPAGG